MSKRKRDRPQPSSQPKQLILFSTEGGTLPTGEQMRHIIELRKSNPWINQILTPRGLKFMMINDLSCVYYVR